MNIIGSNEGEIIILLFLYACGVIAGGFAGALIYRWHWRRRLDRLQRATPGNEMALVGIAATAIDKGDIIVVARGDGYPSWIAPKRVEAIRENQMREALREAQKTLGDWKPAPMTQAEREALLAGKFSDSAEGRASEVRHTDCRGFIFTVALLIGLMILIAL